MSNHGLTLSTTFGNLSNHRFFGDGRTLELNSVLAFEKQALPLASGSVFVRVCPCVSVSVRVCPCSFTHLRDTPRPSGPIRPIRPIFIPMGEAKPSGVTVPVIRPDPSLSDILNRA